MKKFVLCLALLSPFVVEAQDSIDPVSLMAPGSDAAGTDAAAVDQVNPISFVSVIAKSVRAGDWWGVCSAVLVLVVTILRLYGKRLHDLIPDDSLWDKPLWFLFDTKVGGWSMNLTVSLAGTVGTAQLAGEHVTWSLLKSALMLSLTGAAMWELFKDIGDWLTRPRLHAAVIVPGVLVEAPKPLEPPAQEVKVTVTVESPVPVLVEPPDPTPVLVLPPAPTPPTHTDVPPDAMPTPPVNS